VALSVAEVEQRQIWTRAMPLPMGRARRGVGPAWGELRGLRGVVTRIVFQDAQDGYVVARVLPDGAVDDGVAPDREGLFALTGTMPDLVAGEAVEARGWWKKDARHGWSFRVVDYRTTLPATVEGIRRYLASGLVRGVGPVMAGRIADAFGAETLAVIDGTPERLREVEGIGPVRAERVATAWAEHRQVHDVMVALQSYGVSTALAARIYRKYRAQAVRVVTTDPFRLAREVPGIGFKTADKIGRALGMPADAPDRVRAAVLHAMRDFALRGDTLVEEPLLTKQAVALLGVEYGSVELAIEDLIAHRQLVGIPNSEPRLVADARLSGAEIAIAERLGALNAETGKTLLAHASARLTWDALFAPNSSAPLTDEQEAAVRTALTHPVSIVTGGPGTGKTYALQTLLASAESVGARVLLAAPTGRAARRMREATGVEAKTIHRLLELRPGAGSVRGPGNPLPADCVVVDEASMVDVPLMHRLLRALAPGAHLVLVGDPDQLPSVGPGNVLGDLIGSGRFPVTTLTHVFRHGAGSGIALSARAVNRGRIPAPRVPSGDYVFLSRNDPESAVDTIVTLVADRIPTHLGCLPSEVQVLVPMHRGSAGVGALNARLQAALNPPGPRTAELRAHGRVFREGDRVMQLRNDYTRGVFNGDMGIVTRVDPDENELSVKLEEDRLVRYHLTDLSALTHAYAVTVHKAQGAEFRAVVLVCLTTHALAMNRRLLYTALTRAREMAVVVGQEKALEMGVDNWRYTRRATGLGELLAELPGLDVPPLADEDDDPGAWDAYYADDEDAIWDAIARTTEPAARRRTG
jgi:exodeoxyribonuclease V alpha subunit